VSFTGFLARGARRAPKAARIEPLYGLAGKGVKRGFRPPFARAATKKLCLNFPGPRHPRG
jgi:hypothetical protein